MNIVYLIGNGFDVNLGLDTRYTDFYSSYIKENSQNSKDVIEFKKRLKFDMENDKGIKLWKDLEMWLGEDTKNINSIDSLWNIVKDLNDELKKYLKTQEDKLDIDDKNIVKLIKDFIHPEKFFDNDKRAQINSCYRQHDANNLNFNIMTFNYTRTLEKIFHYQNEDLLIKDVSIPNVHLNNICHIHGIVNEQDIIIGVNDPSQISNTSFKENPSALDVLVKPHINNEIGNHIIERCYGYIQNANLICLFGLSLGDSDKMWWQNLGQILMGNTNVLMIYCVYDDNFSADSHRYEKWKQLRECKDELCKKLGIPETLQGQVKQRLYIYYCENLFKINMKSPVNIVPAD